MGLTRLGVLGAGIMGERLLRAAEAHPDFVVSGVWDPAAEACARLAATFPTLALQAGAAEVIAGADCVYIASPPATHLSHARAALAGGCAVFCEKPLAVDLADAAAFVANAAGQRIAVNFPFASAPPVARLAAWLAEGDAPEQAAISVGFKAWPRGWQHAAASWLDAPAQGGFTREVVSHFLFLARRLLGPLALRHATAGFPEPGCSERIVSAELRAGNTALRLDGEVGATEAADENSFTVLAGGTALRLRDWATAERRGADGAWHPDADAIPHEQARPLVLQRQLDGVVRLTEGKPHLLATAEEAYAVQRVVEEILLARA